MFTNSKTRAVWVATVGLMVSCSFRSAAGDELLVVQQPQPAIRQSSVEIPNECNCIRCRYRQSWLGRNSECVFHWYTPSRLKHYRHPVLRDFVPDWSILFPNTDPIELR